MKRLPDDEERVDRKILPSQPSCIQLLLQEKWFAYHVSEVPYQS